ncbi:MAG: 16S rRNA (guanine(527)-N(7))-methyltransferase RsmG [Ramlibacter sp.]
MNLDRELRAGVVALGLTLDDGQVGRLLQYLALLQKWGRVYNLTALLGEQEMLTHHLLDSLAVVEPLRRQTAGAPVRLLDVGSGAGLPGVVIAICCPHVRVDCLDAVAKKAAFVQQAAATLALPNLRGVHGRVERVEDGYDVVSSRAFASLAEFVAGSRQALAPAGVWLAMKGKRPDAELAALPPAIEVFHVEQLAVPGLDAERCIVWMRPAAKR